MDSQRTTVDWIHLLSNSIRGQFRLENCILSPYPGEKDFCVEKIPPKVWQEIGNMLTAEDFHPKLGGCNPRAPRFVSWTAGVLLLPAFHSFLTDMPRGKEVQKRVQ